MLIELLPLRALEPKPKSNILENVEMGEQGILLENRIDQTFMRRNVINPHTIEKDVSGSRLQETSDYPKGRGFTAPARTQ
jgi:hypothetical protein